MKASVRKWFKIGKPPGKLESIEYIYDTDGSKIKFMKFGIYNDKGIKNILIMEPTIKDYHKDVRFLMSLKGGECER